MALEAADRLIDIIWVNWRCTCGSISRPTFKPSASLLDIMVKSKEISWDFRKIIVEVHESGSSLGAISKRLKVPTKVRKYKQHGSTHRTAQKGDAFCLLDKSVLWCEKCKSIPEQQQKDPVKMLEETGRKYSISTVKRVLYPHNLKDSSARKKPLLQNLHKKTDYGLQLHMGTKIIRFGKMSSDLMRQN